jgi:hypothetical protein
MFSTAQRDLFLLQCGIMPLFDGVALKLRRQRAA